MEKLTNSKNSNSRSFVLRAWNEEKDDQKPPNWRFVLLDAETEERRGFTSLDKLFVTLYAEITGDSSIGHNIRKEEKVYGIA